MSGGADPEAAPAMHWSRFARNLAVFGIGVALNAFLRLIVLFVAARILSPHDYGSLDTLLIIGLICVNIVLLGADSAVQRLVIEDDAADHRRTVYTGSFLVIAPNALVMLVVVTGLLETGVLASFDVDVGTLILFFLIYGLGTALTAVSTTLLRGLHMERRFLLTVGSVFAIRLVSVVLPFAGGDSRLSDFLLFVGAGSLAAGLAAVALNRDFLGLAANWRQVWKRMLVYGAPLGLIVIVAGFQPTLERLMVLHFDFVDMLPRYATSAFPALLLGLMSQVVNSAWAPYALHANRAGDRVGVVRTGEFCIALMALSYLVLLNVSDVVVALAVPTGDPLAHTLFPFIGLVVAMRFLNLFAGFGLTVRRLSNIRFAVYVTGFASGAVISYLLLPELGLSAIPVGFATGGAVAVILEATLAERRAPQHWPFVSFALLLALMFLAAAARQSTYGCHGGASCLPSWLAGIDPAASIAAALWALVLLCRATLTLLRQRRVI